MTQHFDFFEEAALPAPQITAQQAAAYVRATYGVDGDATELGSQQDANFLIDQQGTRYVLKVSNAAFTREDLAAQDRRPPRSPCTSPASSCPWRSPAPTARPSSPSSSADSRRTRGW
ncbi:hypothetical protein [Kribbella sp. NPDC000426]|uniref:hypothetical protein n=1 Tax=Kribbella sp. NPDC000426 TaxID=3154255 RepID=UPI00332C941E